MAQDKTNSDGLLKDKYSSGSVEEQGGWQARLKSAAHDAIDNLHDRLIYGTQGNKAAIIDAAGEEPSEAKDDAGFKKTRAK